MGQIIDGVSILRAAELAIQPYGVRLRSHCVTVVVPDLSQPRVSEAHISIRQKRRLFEGVGLRLKEITSDSLRCGKEQIGEHDLYILQKPVNLSEIDSYIPESAIDIDFLSPLPHAPCISAVVEASWRIVQILARTANPIAIVGAKGHVGSQLERLLKFFGFETQGFDKGDDLNELRNFDTVVSAAGVPHLIRGSQLGAGSKNLLIDIGFTYDTRTNRTAGDFSPEALMKASWYTPVPGGIGPLQALTFLERVLVQIGTVPFEPWYRGFARTSRGGGDIISQ